MYNIEALGPIDPDGGLIMINGVEKELDWRSNNAFPFLGNEQIGLIIGGAGTTHTDLIEEYMGLCEDDDWDAVYDFRDNCTIQGRVWLFNNDEIMIYADWGNFYYTVEYNDKIYYNLCDELGIIPKESYFINGYKVVPIPKDSNNDKLSPIQRKLIGSGMPEVKYRHYRYIDENNNNNKKKMRLNERQLRNVIRESVVRILSERHHINHDNTPQQSRRAWADYDIRNAMQSAKNSGLGPHGVEDSYSNTAMGNNEDFNDDYYVDYGYDIGEVPRQRIDTHTLEKLGKGVNKQLKSLQMRKAYDDIGNHSQYPEDGWVENMRGDEYYYRPDEISLTPKDRDIDAAWEEHGENMISEGRLNRIIRKSIKEVLR